MIQMVIKDLLSPFAIFIVPLHMKVSVSSPTKWWNQGKEGNSLHNS